MCSCLHIWGTHWVSSQEDSTRAHVLWICVCFPLWYIKSAGLAVYVLRASCRAAVWSWTCSGSKTKWVISEEQIGRTGAQSEGGEYGIIPLQSVIHTCPDWLLVRRLVVLEFAQESTNNISAVRFQNVLTPNQHYMLWEVTVRFYYIR